MCQLFLQGNCQFGSHCRNAHSQEEINAAIAAEAMGNSYYSQSGFSQPQSSYMQYPQQSTVVPGYDSMGSYDQYAANPINQYYYQYPYSQMNGFNQYGFQPQYTAPAPSGESVKPVDPLPTNPVQQQLTQPQGEVGANHPQPEVGALNPQEKLSVVESDKKPKKSLVDIKDEFSKLLMELQL